MDKIKTMTDEERQAYFESNKETHRVDPFTDAVNDGVITQEQSAAIKAAMTNNSNAGFKGKSRGMNRNFGANTTSDPSL